ncbi:hypothetical protein M422DRAFT_257946 [Sphaerobolus stellatus SS14]|uniref:Fungal-type protein kinase domain-containing protein n=1 Tax=Sphaerobolus stellatus (strain SS14) TaxID=990650 RepID=A0A0C9UWV9_SPHS4|nr:hypothetical protein M422DRAFT_257946 [Sphaerobolus stellatus SS14]
MSINLINNLVRGGEIYHTPIDDLESFVWVLLWAIFDTLTKNDIQLTRVEQDWFNCLRSNSFEVFRSKGVFINDLPIPQNWSTRFLTFVPLLNEWLDLAAQARLVISKLDSSPSTDAQFYKDYYAQYLEIGVRYLDNLPENWF